MTGTYSYDVFGAVRSQTGGGSNYWQFTGEQTDADSGLQYLRARYYDPGTGRFLGRDPVMAAEPYAYVGNNPVNWVDPRGLASEGGFPTPWPAPNGGFPQYLLPPNPTTPPIQSGYFWIYSVCVDAVCGAPTTVRPQWLPCTRPVPGAPAYCGDVPIGELSECEKQILRTGVEEGFTFGFLKGAKYAVKGVRILVRAVDDIDKLEKIHTILTDYRMILQKCTNW